MKIIITTIILHIRCYARRLNKEFSIHSENQTMKYDMMKTTLRVAYTALTILYFTLPGLPLAS